MNKDFLQRLYLDDCNIGTLVGSKAYSSSSAQISSVSPVDNVIIGSVEHSSAHTYDLVIKEAQAAFPIWRKWPAPKRGEVVRQFGNLLREKKEDLATLVSYEMGKSLQEGLGEVQEMIDICDFATGLSRQLYGLTMHSERENHRMYEQWHPLGIVGIISAFNFPVAVWSWNAMIALVCGNVCVWKGSEKTTLCSLACQKLLGTILEINEAPPGVSCLVTGGMQMGQKIAADGNISLVSATGSSSMGRSVGAVVSKRLSRSLLELGGNNALIITANANLDLAIRAAVFGAIGTAGQRCTSTRRLIVEKAVYSEVKKRLEKVYQQLRIGSPLNGENHMGPLIDEKAVEDYLQAIESAKAEGGSFLFEGRRLEGTEYSSRCYVSPTIVEVESDSKISQVETFAPILYLFRYETLKQALEMQNGVRQGLSSSIITDHLLEAEMFLSVDGSDCGIANVNIGTSGAEIGGAFGGEKDTGGGRESGSDAWKSYMRRQTNTINYGADLPLAQGIRFDF
ncbi:UNVERIFIED_CONTAM: hypothetical protein GTU68_062974 [Idotea baltica]|nr:hypothetical protein [Idotea baltica]